MQNISWSNVFGKFFLIVSLTFFLGPLGKIYSSWEFFYWFNSELSKERRFGEQLIKYFSFTKKKMDRYKFQSFTTCWLCIKQVMIYYTLLSIVDISYYYRTAFKHTLPFYRGYFLPLLIYRVYNLLTAYPQTAFLQRSPLYHYFGSLRLFFWFGLFLEAMACRQKSLQKLCFFFWKIW